jgi:hypothetical protein
MLDHTTLLVDRSIPVPPLDNRGYPSTRPYALMHPGDSFIVAEDAISATRSSASAYSRRHPEFRFTIRRDASGVTRCWRLA